MQAVLPAPAGAQRVLLGGGRGIFFCVCTRPTAERIDHHPADQPTIPLRGSRTGG